MSNEAVFEITDDMVNIALNYFEESQVFEIPTVSTFPDFSESLLNEAVKASKSQIKIDGEMIERSLEYFEKSDVLKIPSVVTYPDFVRDLLSFAIAGHRHSAASAEE